MNAETQASPDGIILLVTERAFGLDNQWTAGCYADQTTFTTWELTALDQPVKRDRGYSLPDDRQKLYTQGSLGDSLVESTPYSVGITPPNSHIALVVNKDGVFAVNNQTGEASLIDTQPDTYRHPAFGDLFQIHYDPQDGTIESATQVPNHRHQSLHAQANSGTTHTESTLARDPETGQPKEKIWSQRANGHYLASFDYQEYPIIDPQTGQTTEEPLLARFIAGEYHPPQEDQPSEQSATFRETYAHPEYPITTMLTAHTWPSRAIACNFQHSTPDQALSLNYNSSGADFSTEQPNGFRHESLCAWSASPNRISHCSSSIVSPELDTATLPLDIGKLADEITSHGLASEEAEQLAELLSQTAIEEPPLAIRVFESVKKTPDETSIPTSLLRTLGFSLLFPPPHPNPNPAPTNPESHPEETPNLVATITTFPQLLNSTSHRFQLGSHLHTSTTDLGPHQLVTNHGPNTITYEAPPDKPGLSFSYEQSAFIAKRVTDSLGNEHIKLGGDIQTINATPIGFSAKLGRQITGLPPMSREISATRLFPQAQTT